MHRIDEDAPIDEIRAVRKRISATVNHDPVRLVERYRQMQQQYSNRVLNEKPDESSRPAPVG